MTGPILGRERARREKRENRRLDRRLARGPAADRQAVFPEHGAERQRRSHPSPYPCCWPCYVNITIPRCTYVLYMVILINTCILHRILYSY